ncbi:MAG: sugar phosphate nucleotidyltransferase, partial [Clostridia bacterium]|nr:sugar phosphate nucleotidyltransferase [Clostridia bacterium]
MKTALLVMAAGIGSRFGGGIKQLAAVDNSGHIIMDYSIHDAIAAGFNKIVFVIRKDIEKDFREAIGDRIEAVCAANNVEVAYGFQDLYNVPGKVPEGRSKPWGTGQAVLAAKDAIDCPFCVINADDYYGKEAFKQLHDYLVSGEKDFCMAGFILKNTLSENGGVTRGICKVDENSYLTEVVETSDIVKTATGAAVNGEEVDADSYVSMNFWGLTPEFMNTLEVKFKEFFENTVPSNPLKAEYLLPIIIGDLLEKNETKVKVLETNDKWFGVTYAEDKPAVI